MTSTRAAEIQQHLDEAYAAAGEIDTLVQHHGTEAERMAWHRARVAIAAASHLLAQLDVLPREVPQLQVKG